MHKYGTFFRGKELLTNGKLIVIFYLWSHEKYLKEYSSAYRKVY